jgi:hypothetical protein
MGEGAMDIKAKFGLAILTVTLLLLNPIGERCSMPAPSTPAPAHPCCPKKPAVPTVCHSPACACVTTPQAPVTVQRNSNDSALLAIPFPLEAGTVLLAVNVSKTFIPFLPNSRESYLSFHQLLL